MKFALSLALGMSLATSAFANTATYTPKIIPQSVSAPVQVMSLDVNPDVKYPVDSTTASAAQGVEPVASESPATPSEAPAQAAAKLPPIEDVATSATPAKQQYQFEIAYLGNDGAPAYEWALTTSANQPVSSATTEQGSLGSDGQDLQDVPCHLTSTDGVSTSQFDLNGHLGKTQNISLFPLDATDSTIKIVISATYGDSDVSRALKVNDTCIVLDGQQSVHTFTSVLDLKDGEATSFKIGSREYTIKPVFVK